MKSLGDAVNAIGGKRDGAYAADVVAASTGQDRTRIGRAGRARRQQGSAGTVAADDRTQPTGKRGGITAGSSTRGRGANSAPALERLKNWDAAIGGDLDGACAGKDAAAGARLSLSARCDCEEGQRRGYGCQACSTTNIQTCGAGCHGDSFRKQIESLADDRGRPGKIKPSS